MVDRTSSFRAMYLELLSMEESAKQLKDANKLADELTVIILSAGRQDEVWKEQQKQFVNLTHRTKQVTVEDSWHSIQVYNSDIVISSDKL